VESPDGTRKSGGDTLCAECQKNPVGKTRRKYCDICGPQASTFLKRRNRAELKADPTAQWPYWLEPWVAKTGNLERARAAVREYQRAYMRKWRARRAAQSSGRDGQEQRRDLPKARDRDKTRGGARREFVAPQVVRLTDRVAATAAAPIG
jgi:hypothetical protein